MSPSDVYLLWSFLAMVPGETFVSIKLPLTPTPFCVQTSPSCCDCSFLPAHPFSCGISYCLTNIATMFTRDLTMSQTLFYKHIWIYELISSSQQAFEVGAVMNPTLQTRHWEVETCPRSPSYWEAESVLLISGIWHPCLSFSSFPTISYATTFTQHWLLCAKHHARHLGFRDDTLKPLPTVWWRRLAGTP